MNYPNAASIPYEWNPDDVILDLYQVQNVSEGFGSEARILPFHEGGFGRVYKVWHQSWNRHMAVKTPKSGLFVTSEQKQAFIKECQTWINLGLHPHVASCHYVRDIGGVPRVFSEYADAGTLGEWISSGKLYEGDAKSILGRILDVAIQFAWGLHHAHESGVIHQDVKPLNALMWNDGTLKVSDFGISGSRQRAKFIAHSGPAQTIMVTAGSMTPSYCSPEQQKGINLDRRTDIWSWAVSIMEIFNGGVSWAFGSAAPYAFEAYLESGPMVGNIPMIPPELTPLFRKCFSQESQKRPATLLECARVIQEYYTNHLQLQYERIEPIEVPDSVENLSNKALSMIDLGRGDDAHELFQKALKRAPADWATIYNYNLYKWRNQLIAANEFLASFDQIKPDTAIKEEKPRLEEGLIWFELGFFDQAAKISELLNHNDPSVQLFSNELQRHIKSNSEHKNLVFKFPDQQLNQIFFSWDESKIFALSNGVWVFDSKAETFKEILGFPDNIKSIKLLPKHGWIAAYHSPEPRKHMITGWDENSEKFFEIIHSEARVQKLAETASAQYLIAQVAYDHAHPTNYYFSQPEPHYKIQTIDIESKTIYDDILDGASLITTSKDSSIIATLSPSTTSYQDIITVWDTQSGLKLASVTREEGDGCTAVIDKDKMYLLTSIPWECGIVATDLVTGDQQTINIRELGVVQSIQANDGQTVILVQSSTEKDGDDYEQVGIYDLETNKCTAILFRRSANHIGLFGANVCGHTDIGRTTGHVLIEMASGVFFLWRSFKGHRAQYLYSNSHTYNESREQKIHYDKLIRVAEENYRFGNKEMALSCIREAREIPGYAFTSEAMNLWHLLSSDFEKSGVRRMVRIATYRRPEEAEYDTINKIGALHSNGEMLAFVSITPDLGEGIPEQFRVFLWNLTTGNIRCLFEDSTSYHKTDRISFRDINTNAFVFLGSGCSRYVICLDVRDSTITKFDRGDHLFNHMEHSSISISNDGEWLALGAARDKKVANSPPIAIWSITTQTSLPFRFDPKTYSAFDVCFCKHHGREVLVIACNLGIQICSVVDLSPPQIVGRDENYRMLACSKCRHFIAAASWSWPSGGKLTTIIEIYATEDDFTLIQSITIDSEIEGMRLTQNGDILVVLCRGILKNYFVSSGDLAFEIQINTDLLSSLTEFSADESKISVIGYDKIDVYEFDWEHRLE